MNIVFLHGRLSTPETSNNAKAVKEHFKNLVKGSSEDVFNVYIPDYKPIERTYSEIVKKLPNWIRNEVDLTEETIFIGISLGGFWAAKLSAMFKYSKCILLNPSLDYYGEDQRPIFCLHTEVTAILNEDDELLDSFKTKEILADRADVIMLKTGGHRMANMKEVLVHIERAVYNEVI